MKARIDRAAAVRAALRRLVARNGFHGASMSAVAAEAGVAAGTAYVHYDGKDDLVLAAYLEVKRELGAAAVADLDRSSTAEERFLHMWRRIHQHLAADPDRARFLVQVNGSPYARAAREMAMAADGDPMLAEATRSDMARRLAPLPPDVLYDLGFGPAVRLAADGTRVSVAMLDTLARACWRAITTPGAAARARVLAMRTTLILAAMLAAALATGVLAAEVAVEPFRHDRFDAVLRRVVDDRGCVDYAALVADPTDLQVYVATLVAVSPDSHPARFPTGDDRLAYWLNAYNASVIDRVVRRYPIDSVKDVFPPLVGFFYLQRVLLGGEYVSLYGLENGVVRKRFSDPRVHFALNCASRGCPRLAARAFTGDGLQAELEREARRFVGEPRNAVVDPLTHTVWLSSIFSWYERDFTNWMRVHHPDEPATLVGYVGRLAEPERRAALDSCTGCAVKFVPYDWRLNDRAAGC